MIVKRIVCNIDVPQPAEAKAFYGGVLGLAVVMELGWIITFAGAAGAAQISVASEGGSGVGVPDISVEVDDLEEALRRVAEAGLAIEYGPASKPWGVRRFFVRDPFGRLVNILEHA